MRAGISVDELGCDVQAVAGLAYAPFQHIARAQFAPDLFCVNLLAFESEGEIARDDGQEPP